MAFEEEFGSEISDSEAEKILTVGDAVKFIENKSGQANTKMINPEDNIMVILSSPSGVGKTTLTKKIQQKYHNFKISVSIELISNLKVSSVFSLLLVEYCSK